MVYANGVPCDYECECADCSKAKLAMHGVSCECSACQSNQDRLEELESEQVANQAAADLPIYEE